MEDRKNVRIINRFDIEDFSKVDDVISELKAYKKKYGDGYFSFEAERYSGAPFLAYVTYRKETDEEYDNRLAIDAKNKEMRRKRYELLKKEFGD